MPRLARCLKLTVLLALAVVLVSLINRPRLLLVWDTLPVELRTALCSPLHHHTATPPLTGTTDNTTTRTTTSTDAQSLRTAIWSYRHYGAALTEFFARKRARFDTLAAAHRPIAAALGYPHHFRAVEPAIAANTLLAARIAQHAKHVYGLLPSTTTTTNDNDDEHDHNDMDNDRDGENSGEDNDKDVMSAYTFVEDAFGHLFRDWSHESSAERQHVFDPILAALQHHLPHGGRVLLPGSGLGRLAHEIAHQGYTVDACELDYSAILAYHFIHNQTQTPLQHTFYPFVAHWVHQPDAAARLQPVRIPDALPNPARRVHLVQGDFLTSFAHDNDDEAAYDAVVTLFFIDMSTDVIDFLETIHRVLKPGGLWVNLGPLKWTKRARLQLSVEEMLRLADLLGLEVDRSSYRAIDSTYAHQPGSLLKFTYVTQFWTAKKKQT